MLDLDMPCPCRHRRADDPIDAEERQADRAADDVGDRIDRADFVKMDLADRRAVDFRLGLADAGEDPPGQVFLGELHLLEYFARVIEYADTGFLLDCAHLAIYQRLKGYAPLHGLDSFPLERVVEMHVAGGTLRDHEGFSWIDDDHSLHVLHDTWTIFTHVIERAPHLRAVVFECERQALDAVRPGFQRLRHCLDQVQFGAMRR